MLTESNIIEANLTGIRYVDELGTERFIDFAACYENYLKKWNDPVYLAQFQDISKMDDERRNRWLERARQIREIAKRNPLTPPWADGPYVEFHTDPPTRFRFSDFDEYGKIIEVIADAGWKTFDQG